MKTALSDLGPRITIGSDAAAKRPRTAFVGRETFGFKLFDWLGCCRGKDQMALFIYTHPYLPSFHASGHYPFLCVACTGKECLDRGYLEGLVNEFQRRAATLDTPVAIEQVPVFMQSEQVICLVLPTLDFFHMCEILFSAQCDANPHPGGCGKCNLQDPSLWETKGTAQGVRMVKSETGPFLGGSLRYQFHFLSESCVLFFSYRTGEKGSGVCSRHPR